MIATGTTTIPVAVRHVERLLDDVCQFWQRRSARVASCIRDLEGIALLSYFEPVHLATEIAPLLAFHDRLLIPDPFMLMVPARHGDIADVAPTVLANIHLLLCWRHLFCSAEGAPILLLWDGAGDVEPGAFTRHDEYVLGKRRQLVSEALSRDIADEDDVQKVAADCSVSDLLGNSETAEAIGVKRDHGAVASRIERYRYAIGDRLSLDLARNDTLFLLSDLHTRLHLLTITLARATALHQDFAVPDWDWPLSAWLLSSESKRLASLLQPSLLEEHLHQTVVHVGPLQWLTHLSLNDVLELRRICPVDTLRQEINAARLKVKRARTTEVRGLLLEMTEAVEKAFSQHSTELAHLRRQRVRRAAAAVGALTVAATMTIAGTLFPPLLVPGAIISLVAGGSAIDLIRSLRDSGRDILAEQRRPLAVLLDLRNEARPEEHLEAVARNWASFGQATGRGKSFGQKRRKR